MASTSGKRCTLSIEQKLEILEALKSKKADDVAKDFKIGYSTVKKIRQNEEEIRKIVMNNGNLSRKRKRESPNEEIGVKSRISLNKFMYLYVLLNKY
jgi:hypothetical protein